MICQFSTIMQESVHVLCLENGRTLSSVSPGNDFLFLLLSLINYPMEKGPSHHFTAVLHLVPNHYSAHA